MNLKYYDGKFQARAMQWWRTLSINEQKAFEKEHKIAGDMARRSEIAEIFDKVNP